MIRVIAHYGAGLSSFGPKKFHSGTKGKGGIRATKGAGDYLHLLKKNSKAVTDLCAWLTGRELTNNSYIGFCAEAIVLAKLAENFANHGNLHAHSCFYGNMSCPGRCGCSIGSTCNISLCHIFHL